MVIAACTWWKFGQIPKANIVSFAKNQYLEKHVDSSRTDWRRPMLIPEKIERKDRQGCLT